MVITLNPDLEKALRELAQQQGRSPEDVAVNALREGIIGLRERSLQPRDEWERRLLSAGSDCGVTPSHEAVSSDGIYE